MGNSGGAGALIETNLGVGQIFIVHQNQIGALDANGQGHLGNLAIHIDF